MTERLLERYSEHLQWLRRKPAPTLQPLFVLNEPILNSDKRVWETGEGPELPPGVRIPQKDIYLVRAALIARPLLVTCDNSLSKSVNSQPLLGLRALLPAEALTLAEET